MSELDIAEKRIPQDGRFKLKIKGRAIDFRVSIMPSVHGEDAVIRILDKESVNEEFSELRLDVLGFTADDLKRLPKNANIVVLTHRPLFDLYPQWDWATADGAQATKILLQHPNVTVFYGHIHQENHHMTGHIAHHAAKSLIFPLPAPGSQPKRAPVPWDAAAPYKGLGFREVEAELKQAKYEITEFPVVRS